MKEFPMMKDAKSDKGDITPIRKSRRGGTPQDMPFPACVFLLGFDVVYESSSLCRRLKYISVLPACRLNPTSGQDDLSTFKRVHAGTLFHAFPVPVLENFTSLLHCIQ